MSLRWQSFLHLRGKTQAQKTAKIDELAISGRTLTISGTYVDLLDPELSIVRSLQLQPGEQAWLVDLDRAAGADCIPIAAAGRITDWLVKDSRVSYKIASPAETKAVTRLKLPRQPESVSVAKRPNAETQWDEASRTLLIRHAGDATPIEVVIKLH